MQLISYFKEVKNELIKVTWPTRQQAWKMTMTVLGMSVFVGVYIGGLDYLFTSLLGIILK
jgi:preprotein translocase subunit SecE